MADQDFTTTLLVNQSPKEAFDAINNVRGWWSEEIEGPTSQLNDEFHYHYEDVHRSKMQIIESVTDEKVVWWVKENYFKFTEDKSEWTGTKISFEISQKKDQTQIVFTHIGLVPHYECFPICRDAWTTYIQQSFKGLITTGKGTPNGKDKPQTENVKKLAANK